MPLCSRPDEPGMRIVFLFGNPIHSIISTRKEGLEQNPTHWANCGYVPSNPNRKIDIFYTDELNYHKMFVEWYYAKPIDHDILCLRYETMYNYLDLLQWFVGQDIKFPAWKTRRSTYESVSTEELVRIEKNHSGFIESVARAADVKLMMRSR
jgi:hypothetical protein